MTAADVFPMLFSVMSNLLAFSQVEAEEAFELTAATAHANGINHDESWVGGVTVQNGFDDIETEAADDRCWCKFYQSCPTCFAAWEKESNPQENFHNPFQ